MKNVKKIIFAGLFTALYLVPTTTFGSTEEQPVAPVTAPVRTTATMPLRLLRADEQTTQQGCWPRFGKCLKRTKSAVQQVLPVVEFVMSEFLTGELKEKAELAIGVMKKSSKLVTINDDGSIVLPDGETLANAVVLTLNQYVGALTDESEMLISLLLSVLPEGDYQSKTKMISYLALGDNPKTPTLVKFNPETGDFGVGIGKASSHLSINLFKDTTPQAQALIKDWMAEYLKAATVRTAQEEATPDDKRAPGLFLPKEGKIVSAYRNLVESTPAYQLVELAQNIISGDASVVDALGNWVETLA